MSIPCEAQASFQGYYDRIASYLDGSYKEYTQHKGKSPLNVYSLLQAKGGKTCLIFPIYLTAQFQSCLLTMILYLIAGLELMWWLH